jgi:hypothetical protein
MYIHIYVSVRACLYVCVCLCFCDHAHGLSTKYSPLFFLSKFLLLDSIDIAKMFG